MILVLLLNLSRQPITENMEYFSVPIQARNWNLGLALRELQEMGVSIPLGHYLLTLGILWLLIMTKQISESLLTVEHLILRLLRWIFLMEPLIFRLVLGKVQAELSLVVSMK